MSNKKGQEHSTESLCHMFIAAIARRCNILPCSSLIYLACWVRSNWNQTILCWCKTKHWYLIHYGHAWPLRPTTSNPTGPRSPLFGVGFSICFLHPFQQHTPQRCPFAEICSEEQSPDSRRGGWHRLGSRKLTHSRVYVVMSWILQLNSTCYNRSRLRLFGW